MRVTVLTIGDEIVGGHTVDTNAAYIARRLGELGLRVWQIASVGDDAGEIRAALERATASDLVFVTGGLGPTHDDITKQVVAETTKRPLVIDADLQAALRLRFGGRAGARPEVIDSLATVPEGARLLDNPLGAAPGIAIDSEGTRIYLMPGVPREMEAVFEETIAAEIDALSKTEFTKSRLIRTIGLRESQIVEKLEDTMPSLGVSVGFLPAGGAVDLRLVASADDEEAAIAALESAAARIARVLGRNVYSTKGEDLNVVVGKMLIESGVTVAVAESCTGGLIGHLLTDVAGISACLERDVVTYSNRAKIDILGVAEALIGKHGAVSRQVAEAMAHGVRQAAGTHLGVATTGIAGPTGGSPEKPVGLVYVGLAHADGCTVTDNVFPGSREIVKVRAAVHALDLVRCHLLDRGV